MTVDQEKITLRYQVKRSFCHCCEQELKNPEISEVREFDFHLKDLKEHGDWHLYDEHDELEEVADAYIYEDITYFASSSLDRVSLCEGELERFVQFIKRNFIK